MKSAPSSRRTWNGKNVTDAIAEYEKTLITPNSRFDKWLKGDDKALTAQEIEGYQRFKMYRCSSCHVGKSVGGQSFEYMDLKKAYFEDRGNPLGSDEGLKGFTGKAEDLHRFKVPNLRNVELTAPYLHDGTVTPLDEAVRIMGVYLSGMDIPKGDRDLIVGFLRTLTELVVRKRIKRGIGNPGAAFFDPVKTLGKLHFWSISFESGERSLSAGTKIAQGK